jgi:hypothetical protein
VRVFSITRRLGALAAVRGAAGLACFAAALAAGADSRPALAAFALGASGSAALLVSDRRSRFLGPPRVESLPPGAGVAPLHRAVAAGLWPSTLGVTVFAVVALAADAVLAALMAGILAGMAVATVIGLARIVVSERAEGVRYYGELHGKRIFSSRR